MAEISFLVQSFRGDVQDKASYKILLCVSVSPPRTSLSPLNKHHGTCIGEEAILSGESGARPASGRCATAPAASRRLMGHFECRKARMVLLLSSQAYQESFAIGARDHYHDQRQRARSFDFSVPHEVTQCQKRSNKNSTERSRPIITVFLQWPYLSGYVFDLANMWGLALALSERNSKNL